MEKGGGGGGFFEKGPFCEIIYYRGLTVAEVNVHGGRKMF